MGERKELIYTVKELVALNPKIAKYIFLLSLVIVIGKILVEILNKIFPDLPYKHSNDIKDNTVAINKHTESINKHTESINKHTESINKHTESINKHTESINNLEKSIIRIEGKLDTLFSDIKREGKK